MVTFAKTVYKTFTILSGSVCPRARRQKHYTTMFNMLSRRLHTIYEEWPTLNTVFCQALFHNQSTVSLIKIRTAILRDTNAFPLHQFPSSTHGRGRGNTTSALPGKLRSPQPPASVPYQVKHLWAVDLYCPHSMHFPWDAPVTSRPPRAAFLYPLR